VDEDEPCAKLNNLTDVTKDNIVPTVDLLKGTLFQSGENGAIFNRTMDAVGTTTYTSSQLPYSSGDAIQIPFTPNVTFTGIHTHPSKGYPMFSWNDIMSLYIIALRTSAVNQKELSLMVVVRADYTWEEQVYAIKIADINALKRKIFEQLNQPKYNGWTLAAKYDDLDGVELLDKYATCQSNYEKAFLDFFDGGGLGLYKADPDLSNWNLVVKSSNILLAPNGVKHIPCL
jgi:hypothetical protein